MYSHSCLFVLYPPIEMFICVRNKFKNSVAQTNASRPGQSNYTSTNRPSVK